MLAVTAGLARQPTAAGPARQIVQLLGLQV